MSEPVTYAGAGVDTEAGDRAVELMAAAVKATHGPQVLGGAGGFAFGQGRDLLFCESWFQGVSF